MEVNLAFYRKKDWKRFLNMIHDRESMFSSWKEWHKSYLRIKKEFISKGVKVNDIEEDLDELDKFCQIRGLKNDGKARSKFVSMKNYP